MVSQKGSQHTFNGIPFDQSHGHNGMDREYTWLHSCPSSKPDKKCLHYLYTVLAIKEFHTIGSKVLL